MQVIYLPLYQSQQNSPPLAVSQAVRCDAALKVLDHDTICSTKVIIPKGPHDAPLMFIIGGRAHRGLDDPVYTHCLLISDSLNEHPPSLCNSMSTFLSRPLPSKVWAVANPIRIRYAVS